MNNYQWTRIGEIMSKGLDKTFLDYGVRRQDLDLLQKLADDQNVPVDLVEDLLRMYNKAESESEEIDTKFFVRELEKLIQHNAR